MAIKLLNNDGSHSVTLNYNPTDDRSITMPDASGTLALLNSPALTGTPTAPTADSSTNTDQIATTKFVKNLVGSQSGSVVQVVSTTKTDTFSTTSTSWVDVPGLSLSITRKFTDSKVLVIASGSAGMSAADSAYLRLLSDGNPICVPPAVSGYASVSTANFYGGSSDGNNNETFAINYLDNPPSSSTTTTYKFQASSPQGATLYINALGSDSSGQNYSARTVSNITLMEIKS